MRIAEKLRGLPTSNAAYGIAEYISQPLLMVCSAPFLLHRLGVEQYAIWVLAGAAVTGGTLLSSGFGDAAIKFICAYRGQGDHGGVQRVLRSLLALNLIFGTAFALLLWSATPFLVAHLPHLDSALRSTYQQCLAIGSLLLIVKTTESVFISAQRAYERYSVTTRISIGSRAATVLAAVVIAETGGSAVRIMLATLLIAALALALQATVAWRDMALTSLLPVWDRAAIGELWGFGCFSWLQGLVAMLSSQADRLLVGYLLGAPALAYYSICVQIALPIHGIAAAGLQVLFPYLGAKLRAIPLELVRKTFTVAFAVNVALVLALALPVALGSHFILKHWMGADFAAHAAVPLCIVACGFAFLGLNVTGHFVLLALGRIRLLALANMVGAVAMLAAIALLAPRFGIVGAALGRLIYGPITWLIYRPLLRTLRGPMDATKNSSALLRACEKS